MKIEKHLHVPTGDILVVQGENGNLEMLSLQDYGQSVNLNQNRPVPDGLPLLPLTEKWVVTISTQYGCSMRCKFCDVPKVGPGKNATFNDLTNQVSTALNLSSSPNYTKRLNVHFARMGEPSWNKNVLECSKWLYDEFNSQYNPHPVVSTMMPKHNRNLLDFIYSWMRIKNEIYKGNAGLQLSINSTDEAERELMFSGNSCSLEEISDIMREVADPIGRKITLNFAVANYTVDSDILLKYFDPNKYIIKLTPMHKTSTALGNNIQTNGDYTSPEPYAILADSLRKVGYDVLVFIASRDEDLGLITCGNAILSGSLPHKYTQLI